MFPPLKATVEICGVSVEVEADPWVNRNANHRQVWLQTIEDVKSAYDSLAVEKEGHGPDKP